MNVLPDPRPDWICSWELHDELHDDSPNGQIWMARLQDLMYVMRQAGFLPSDPIVSKKTIDGKPHYEVKIPGNEMKKEGEA